MKTASTLRAIQETVTAHLLQPSFQYEGETLQNPIVKYAVPVLSRLKKDLLNEIESGLAGTGMFVFVFPPEPKKVSPDVGLSFRDATLKVRVVENPILNPVREDFDAWDCWETFVTLLDGFTPPIPAAQMIYLGDPFDDQSDDELRVFEATFNLAFALTRRKST